MDDWDAEAGRGLVSIGGVLGRSCAGLPTRCGTAVPVSVPIPLPARPDDGHLDDGTPCYGWGDSYSWWRRAGESLSPGCA